MAFSNENIHNIKRELVDAYGKVTELTNVMTFDSFVYRYMLCPYEPSILQHFGCTEFLSKGITMIDPPPQRLKNDKGNMVSNRKYVAKDQLEHYVSRNNQYYCSTLSELIIQVKNGRNSLCKRVAKSINLFYDQVLIDEFQDFRKHDYELIMSVAKHLQCILMVGDYHQHSVSGMNNSGKPFKKGKVDIMYEEFIKEIEMHNFKVDSDTLNKSRRCSPNICQYVQKKLGISIQSSGDNFGTVIWGDDNAKDIIENPNILKLVYMDATKYTFNAMNWSYSKGDTVDNSCVILTEKFDNLDKDEFNIKGISTSTINKLYVALTRSRGNLYIISASTFKKLKDNYRI